MCHEPRCSLISRHAAGAWLELIGLLTYDIAKHDGRKEGRGKHGLNHVQSKRKVHQSERFYQRRTRRILSSSLYQYFLSSQLPVNAATQTRSHTTLNNFGRRHLFPPNMFTFSNLYWNGWFQGSDSEITAVTLNHPIWYDNIGLIILPRWLPIVLRWSPGWITSFCVDRILFLRWSPEVLKSLTLVCRRFLEYLGLQTNTEQNKNNYDYQPQRPTAISWHTTHCHHIKAKTKT